MKRVCRHTLACIARRSGGVPEIWPTDQGSLLVQAHDDGSNMAEALYSLLTLPGEALLGIKKDFYAHAVQGFHVEEQARKVEEWLFNIY